MRTVSVEERAAVREALIRDGYSPPPAVDQQWEDLAVTWLPEGHRSVVTITSIGKTISGWQCRVRRDEVDGAGQTVGEPGCGIVYLDHLIQGYRLVDG